MRSILTLSLPADVLMRLKEKARLAGMSVSAYVRRVLAYEEQLITEDELLERSRDAQKNYKKGKVKTLKNVDDLDKPW